jgi:hypothetical protein
MAPNDLYHHQGDHIETLVIYTFIVISRPINILLTLR